MSQPIVDTFTFNTQLTRETPSKTTTLTHEALFMVANRGIREALDLLRPWFDYTSETHASQKARQVAACIRFLLAKLTYDASKSLGFVHGNHAELTTEDLGYIRNLLHAELDADSDSRHLRMQMPDGLMARFGRLL